MTILHSVWGRTVGESGTPLTTVRLAVASFTRRVFKPFYPTTLFRATHLLMKEYLSNCHKNNSSLFKFNCTINTYGMPGPSSDRRGTLRHRKGTLRHRRGTLLHRRGTCGTVGGHSGTIYRGAPIRSRDFWVPGCPLYYLCVMF